MAIAPAQLVIERRGPATMRSRMVYSALAPLMRRPLKTLQSATFGPELIARAARIDELAARMPAPRGTRTTPALVGGVPGEWVRGRGVETSRTAVLYLHGGGWFFGGLHTHRTMVSRISAASGAIALSVKYRMVPEVELGTEVDDCAAAYEGLLEHGFDPQDIAVIGDSAGGHLAFATALRLRDSGIPLPGTVVSMSGCIDLDLTAKKRHENARRDPLRALAALEVLIHGVLGDLDPSDPAVSPLYADLAGLPPSLLTAGSTESVYVDSEVMAHRLAEAGVPTVLQVWDRQLHVFQAFAPLIPEAGRAISDLGKYLRATLGATRADDLAS
jgi:epsilon-lactone hydrolase